MFSLNYGFADAAVVRAAAAAMAYPRVLAVFSSSASKITPARLNTAANGASPGVVTRRAKKHEPQSSRKFRWVLIITGATGSLSFLTQIIVGAEFGFWWKFAISAFGMFCTVLTVVLPIIQQGAYEQTLVDVEEATKAGRLGAHTRMQDSLIPVFDAINDVASQFAIGERRGRKSNLIRGIVESAARDIGLNRTRACYFEYELGPPPSLECHAHWTGRGTKPARYTNETQLGKNALTMVSKCGYRFCADVHEDPAKALYAEKDYRTYIAVTVSNDSRIFGMLTVDAPAVGDISENDVPQVKMLALLLAAGLSAAGLSIEEEGGNRQSNI